jgi:hypothetical protein
MKAYLFSIPIIAAVLVMAGVSPATAQDLSLKANVPLDFKVGAAALPRGEYYISRMDGHPNVVLMRNERRGVVFLAQETGSADTGKPQLVFRRYADRYFLSEIRFDASDDLRLPETREERAAAEQRADRSDSQMGTVVIAAERR